MRHLLTEEEWERLWSKVDIRGPDECWEWKASKQYFGHGEITIKRIKQHPLKATRVVMADLGYIDIFDINSFVLHKCDNPLCVNPYHLYIGCHMDNMTDVAKSGKRKGDKANSAKLSEEDVKFIKYQLKYNFRRGLVSKLARKFGVTHECIRGIKIERYWTHIEV
jgi:hypothetical protein